MSFVKPVVVALSAMFIVACSDPTSQKSFGDVGGGLTNFGAACEKHGGLKDYKQKGKKVYIYCKNGRKLTYTNF